MADSKKNDVGEAEVQAKVDKETERGYIGHDPDETPDDHYTLPGVVAGKPTPENPEGRKN